MVCCRLLKRDVFQILFKNVKLMCYLYNSHAKQYFFKNFSICRHQMLYVKGSFLSNTVLFQKPSVCK